MRLYSYWRSSSSWRVRIALELKGLTYQYAAVDLLGGEQTTPSFTALSPRGEVPVLELEEQGGPVFLSQSMAIIEYLDERYPSPPLLPGSPLARARIRQLAQMVVSGVQPLQNLSVQRFVEEQLGGDRKAWAHLWISRGLLALERAAARTAGSFLVGDAVSLADVVLVPQMYAARRNDVDLSNMPTLCRVEAVCSALVPFARAHPDKQPDAVTGGVPVAPSN